MIFANYYQQDRIENASFEEVDRHHTYNPTITNRLLRSEFLKREIELNNPDVNIGHQTAFNIFHDGQRIENIIGPKYLIATENPYICPLNRDEKYLSGFDQVFTWNRDLLHLPNVTQIFIPNQIHWASAPSFSERPIFSCLINANKAFPIPLSTDLYRERINVIRWYEKYAPQYFSLFGLGWSKPSPALNTIQKLTRRFKRLATQIYGYKPFPSYTGEVEDKLSIYRKSKFAYCYENVADLPDYISEKIFDCLFAGCVPIYWGSNTINERIPSACYIDRRQFKDTADVHQFLLNINDQKYQAYQDSIKLFLLSKDAMKFDTSTYVDIIVSKISGDLNL